MRKKKQTGLKALEGETVPASPPAKTKLEIVQGIQRFRPLFQGVLDLTDFVADIDNLMRDASEAQARMDEKRRTEAEVDGRIAAKGEALKAAEGKLADTERKVQEAVAGIKGEPEKILRAAKDEAHAIVANAKTEAGKAKAAAETAAAGIRSRAEQIKADAEKEAEQIIQDAKAAAATFDSQVAESRNQLADASSQVDAKILELSTLDTKITAAKAQISKILGA